MRTSFSLTAKCLMASGIILVHSGCIAATVGVTAKVVGDAIDQSEAKDRFAQLEGQPPESADAVFGERADTLQVVGEPSRQLLLYPFSKELTRTTFWVVEVKGGHIVNLSKKVRNDESISGKLKQSGMRKKLLGNSPEVCERNAKLSAPEVILESRKTGDHLRVYNISKSEFIEGVRYAILRFNPAQECIDITLVGLKASSKKGGFMKAESP